METDEETETIDLTGATQGGLFGIDFAPSGKRGAPSSSRAAVAERKRRFVAAQAEIGEPPAVADPERRARCETSFVAFAREYCMGTLLAREPAPRMVEYAQRLEAAICGTGLTHVRFPRGAGKTTWIKAAIAWGVATGRLRFPVVFCASADLAGSALADIWAVFESEPFAEDFPEISWPIAQGGGSAQRWLSQTCGGVPTKIKKTARELRLPTVAGSKASGAVIRARGAGSSTRGMVAGALRPDYVLLDDIQTRKDAESVLRTEKLSRWVEQDVLGLGGARQVTATMASTPIRRGDLSELFADAERHPEWKTVETPLVIAWPKREDLWARYDELWRDELRAGGTTNEAATAFYEAHRAEMDEGGEVLDPGAFDPRIERSGLQHARNLLLAQGREAFDAEYQLVTKSAQAAVTVSPALVASRVNGVPRLAMPAGTVRAFAFVDVNAAAGISWSVTAFGPKRVAAVVDYGRWPGDGRRLVAQNVPTTQMQQEVGRGVAHVVDHLLALRLARPNGRAARIDAVWVDIGWLQDTVLAVVEGRERVTGRSVRGCKGYSNVYFEAGAAGRHVVTPGPGVNEREWDGRRWLAQNSDLWKETAQRAFLAEPGTPGSIALYGSTARAHDEFSYEMSSETLEEKLDSKRGTIYRWILKPGASNHWLDTTSGCFAMAAWHRVYATDEDVARSATMPTAATPRAVRRARSAGLRRVAATIAL
ncbi:MAG: hypothetical protein IJV65_06630 [Kiritimatiellae bacterium]|nr:hypothetical protein [Kiritimatiellia bacterium]